MPVDLRMNIVFTYFSMPASFLFVWKDLPTNIQSLSLW